MIPPKKNAGHGKFIGLRAKVEALQIGEKVTIENFDPNGRGLFAALRRCAVKFTTRKTETGVDIYRTE